MIFPEGFYWGAATAAYQIEGGIDNCDWAKAAQDGRVPVCGRACDHYNRFEADFDIAKELGHNCHRISVEWARIEPEEGKFDEAAIDHYRQVLAVLRARRIKPMITLWHFTSPLWFSETGGFERKDAPEIFARYCGYVAKKLGHDCRYFSTINEPTVAANNGWVRGTWPPFKEVPGMGWALKNVPGARAIKKDSKWSNLLTHFRVRKNMVKAHNAAYDAIKKNAFGVDVSIVHHVIFFHSNGNPINKLKAWFMNWIWTHQFIKKVYRKCDSIGVNYYLHKKFGDSGTYEKTDMNWDIYPEGLCGALLMMRRYQKTLWVSEAGIADAADQKRAEYIKELIRSMYSAMQNDADVRGYMYWSLLDNYEWAHGFDKRFGLVNINYETLERTVRPSAYVYKKIIEQNGLIE